MYDYFQESIYYKNEVVFDWINYWENECGYYIKYIDNSNDLKIYENKNIECMFILMIMNTKV